MFFETSVFGRIFHFPIDFCMGLTTVQHYCAAFELITCGIPVVVTVITCVCVSRLRWSRLCKWMAGKKTY